MKTGGILLIILAWLEKAVYAHTPEEGYPMGPWMMWWGHNIGWWIFPLVMIVLMAIFFLLFFLFRGKRGGRLPWCDFGDQRDAETPLDILKKRYAKGEIGKEEFEAMKKDLQVR
jgi:putative membrane protein